MRLQEVASKWPPVCLYVRTVTFPHSQNFVFESLRLNCCCLNFHIAPLSGQILYHNIPSEPKQEWTAFPPVPAASNVHETAIMSIPTPPTATACANRNLKAHNALGVGDDRQCRVACVVKSLTYAAELEFVPFTHYKLTCFMTQGSDFNHLSHSGPWTAAALSSQVHAFFIEALTTWHSSGWLLI